MKCFITVILLVSLWACSGFGEYAPMGARPRDCYGLAGSGEIPAADPYATMLGSSDTMIYVSAVCFPESYDWLRDTSYGCSSASIILYKNGIELLDIPAGQAAPCDRHHIIDGHLYAHWCSGNRTHVSRDGKEILSFAGTEHLVGLLPTDRGLYSLGNVIDEPGMCFRCQGEVITRNTGARALGGFCETSFGSNGALLWDGQSVYFSFLFGGVRHYVKDGSEIPPEQFTQAARGRYRCSASDGVYSFSANVLSCSRDGELKRVYPANQKLSFGQVRPFTGQHALDLDGVLYMALNPVDTALLPNYRKGSEFQELDVNGFLSGIEVVTNPPN